MAVINTSKSAEDYAKALNHLLPPGDYFDTKNAKKLTQAQADELARIHGKVDTEFNINVSDDTLGWTLKDYRTILKNAGMSDFLVFDQTRLPFTAGRSKAGHILGNELNVYKIFIAYQAQDALIFQSILPLLQQHKLTHTTIIAFQFYQFYAGQKCIKSIQTQL